MTWQAAMLFFVGLVCLAMFAIGVLVFGLFLLAWIREGAWQKRHGGL